MGLGRFHFSCWYHMGRYGHGEVDSTQAGDPSVHIVGTIWFLVLIVRSDIYEHLTDMWNLLIAATEV